MKLAINQPYLFPYLGYFSLIKHTDQFILLDEVQFIKQGWIHRNRVLAQEGGWKYIRVPLVKHHQTDRISQVRINNEEDWRSELLRQLIFYKNKAPYYGETMGVVEKALDIETDSIGKLNEHVLKIVCHYLGIAADIRLFTEMALAVKPAEAPDEVPLHICQSLGNVEEYWNLEGGAEFYDRRKFQQAGIEIKFLKMNLHQYPQINKDFEPALSIVDVLMFNDPEQIRGMLEDYQLI